MHYNNLGQPEKALEEALEFRRLCPQISAPGIPLARALLKLNRFDEAKEVLEQAVAQKRDNNETHNYLYQIAFVQGDAAAMKRQIDWATGTRYEYEAVSWQADAAAFRGQARKARELTDRAIALAQSRNLEEMASVVAIVAAEREAMFGNGQRARRDLSRVSSFT